MAKPIKSRQKNEVSRQMLIDPNFQAEISVFDVGIVAFLGRDYEMSLYAMTPRVNRMWTSTKENVLGPNRIESDIVHRETARIRMGSATAAHLALNIAMTFRENEPEIYNQFLESLGDRVEIKGSGEEPGHEFEHNTASSDEGEK
jgi:hypothetical protein